MIYIIGFFIVLIVLGYFWIKVCIGIGGKLGGYTYDKMFRKRDGRNAMFNSFRKSK